MWLEEACECQPESRNVVFSAISSSPKILEGGVRAICRTHLFLIRGAQSVDVGVRYPPVKGALVTATDTARGKSDAVCAFPLTVQPVASE